MLRVDGLHTYYGRAHILADVSLDAAKGEIVVLLGRNGAGKSTTLKSIMGLVPAAQGAIRFLDRDIAGAPPHEIARLGLGYVPEDRRIFTELTVMEMARKPGGMLKALSTASSDRCSSLSRLPAGINPRAYLPITAD